MNKQTARIISFCLAGTFFLPRQTLTIRPADHDVATLSPPLRLNIVAVSALFDHDKDHQAAEIKSPREERRMPVTRAKDHPSRRARRNVPRDAVNIRGTPPRPLVVSPDVKTREEQAAFNRFRAERFNFLNKLVDHSERNDVIALRKYIYDNEDMSKQWFHAEPSLAQRYRMLETHQYEFIERGIPWFRLLSSAASIHFTDRYGFAAAKAITAEIAGATGAILIDPKTRAAIHLVDEDGAVQRKALDFLAAIDTVLRKNARLTAAVLRLTGEQKIHLGIIKKLEAANGSPLAISFREHDSVNKSLFFSMEHDEFAFPGTVVPPNSPLGVEGSSLTYLERAVGHEIAHLYTNSINGQEEVLLPKGRKQTSAVQKFVATYAPHAPRRSLTAGACAFEVFAALRTLKMQRFQQARHNKNKPGDIDDHVLQRQFFITAKAADSPDDPARQGAPHEFIAEYLSLFWLVPGLIRRHDEEMHRWLTILGGTDASQKTVPQQMSEPARDILRRFFAATHDALTDVMQSFHGGANNSRIMQQFFADISLLDDYRIYVELLMLSGSRPQATALIEKYLASQRQIVTAVGKSRGIKKAALNAIVAEIANKQKQLVELKEKLSHPPQKETKRAPIIRVSGYSQAEQLRTSSRLTGQAI